MDRLFDDFGGGLWRSPFCGSFDLPFQRTEQNLSAIPAVDVSDTDKAYEITAELPGMDEKNVKRQCGCLDLRELRAFTALKVLGPPRERPMSVKRKAANQCAQCGSLIIAPEWSEHLSERCVRHVWSCELCGYQFESTVHFPVLELAADLQAA
jgi:hypothetical protein